MKKLSKEEVKELPILKKGRYTRLHMQMLQLQPGEGLQVNRGEDWISKRPPYQLISRFAKKHKWKMTSGRSRDGKGWIIIREA
jgi:hypothetical protein